MPLHLTITSSSKQSQVQWKEICARVSTNQPLSSLEQSSQRLKSSRFFRSRARSQPQRSLDALGLARRPSETYGLLAPGQRKLGISTRRAFSTSSRRAVRLAVATPNLASTDKPPRAVEESRPLPAGSLSGNRFSESMHALWASRSRLAQTSALATCHRTCPLLARTFRPAIRSSTVKQREDQDIRGLSTSSCLIGSTDWLGTCQIRSKLIGQRLPFYFEVPTVKLLMNKLSSDLASDTRSERECEREGGGRTRAYISVPVSECFMDHLGFSVRAEPTHTFKHTALHDPRTRRGPPARGWYGPLGGAPDRPSRRRRRRAAAGPTALAGGPGAAPGAVRDASEVYVDSEV